MKLSLTAVPDDGPRNVPQFRELQSKTTQLELPVPSPLGEHYFSLSLTERASVRINPGSIREVPACFGVVSEAAFRIALLRERGILRYTSAWSVAQYFQVAFYGGHPIAMRRSRRGHEMLVATAEYGLVSMTVASPCLDDPLRWRRLPLVDRLTELARG